MYTALIVIGSVIVFIIGFAKLRYWLRKQEYSDWEIGDTVILRHSSDIIVQARKVNGSNIAKLVGWSDYDVFLKIGDTTYQENHNAIESNKSAVWRRHYKACKETMGKNPEFNPTVNYIPNETTGGGTIDGQSIDTMNETLCQVYLKKAIDEEDYKTAALIRKRLENFR